MTREWNTGDQVGVRCSKTQHDTTTMWEVCTSYSSASCMQSSRNPEMTATQSSRRYTLQSGFLANPNCKGEAWKTTNCDLRKISPRTAIPRPLLDWMPPKHAVRSVSIPEKPRLQIRVLTDAIESRVGDVRARDDCSVGADPNREAR